MFEKTLAGFLTLLGLALIWALGISRILLVTSVLHMPHAKRFFEDQEL